MSVEPSPLSLAELTTRAQDVRQLYDRLNHEAGRPDWDIASFMLGFTGDVGTLAKLVMARQGLRPSDGLDDKLAHELADCLWSLLILAAECQVDLEAACLQTMNQLESRISDEQRNTSR